MIVALPAGRYLVNVRVEGRAIRVIFITDDDPTRMMMNLNFQVKLAPYRI